MEVVSIKAHMTIFVLCCLLECMFSDDAVNESSTTSTPATTTREWRLSLFGDNSSHYITIPNILPDLYPISTDDDGPGDIYDITLPNVDDISSTIETDGITGLYTTTTFPSLPLFPLGTPSNTPSSDNNPDVESITNDLNKPKFAKSLLDDVERQLKSERAIHFIGNLTNDFQREVVLTNLRTCPFIPLCHFALELDVDKYADDELNYGQCCSRCYCRRDACISDGDCCPDVEWFVQKPTILPPGVQQMCFTSELRKGNVISNGEHSAKAIVGCPIGTPPKLVSKCVRDYESAFLSQGSIRLEDMTLVHDTFRNVTYRNKYCAACNDVESRDFLFWEVKFECSDSTPVITSSKAILEHVFNKTIGCIIEFLRPLDAENIELCSTSRAISRCNVTGLWEKFDPVTKTACEHYSSYVLVEYTRRGDTNFRNVFCAQCNGYDPSPLDMCYDIQGREGFADFSSLLRLHQQTPIVDESCSVGERYDNIKEECRPVVCSTGLENIGGLCVVVIDIREILDLDIVIRLQPHEGIQLGDAYYMVPKVKSAVMVKLQDIDSEIDMCGTQVFLQSDVKIENDKGYMNPRKGGEHEYLENEIYKQQMNGSMLVFYEMRIQIGVMSTRESAFKSLASLNGSILTVRDSDTILFTSEKEELDTQRTFEMRFAEGGSGNSKKFDYIDSAGYYLLADTVGHADDVIDIHRVRDFVTLIDEIDNTFQFPYLQWNDASATCKSTSPRYNLFSLRSCPIFRIPWTDFNWNPNLDGLSIVGSLVQIDVSEYTIEIDKSFSTNILICIDTYLDKLKSLRFKQNRQQDDVQFAKFVISIAFVSVTVICLLISLITFFLFKQLRTIPSKNNIALIVSLILAHSLYLVGGTGGFDKDSPVCKAIGLLTHFFWLLAIFWMNACTFHMCRVLLKTRNMSRGLASRKHVYYHVYCILMSILFVLTNITVSMVISDSTDIGYGKVICFVSTQTMIDYTFGLPAGLVVIANLGMFLAIIISLKGGPSIQRTVKHDRNYFLVFIKLSTVTGITWVFGFIYMWTGIEVFSFLFIAFNATQGVFIMLAFVCNKRTLALYKDRFIGRDVMRSGSENRSAKTLSTST